MTDKEKIKEIRNEIERCESIITNFINTHTNTIDVGIGTAKLNLCKYLKSFIDNLPEEVKYTSSKSRYVCTKSINDYEKFTKDKIYEVITDDQGKSWVYDDNNNVFLFGKYCVYFTPVEQEPLNDELIETAQTYSNKLGLRAGLTGGERIDYTDIANAVIFGATWQKEKYGLNGDKFDNLVPYPCTKCPFDCYTKKQK